MTSRWRSFAHFVRSNDLLRWLAHAAEVVVFGTRIREQIATSFLGQYYESKFRRVWVWRVNGEQHFVHHDRLLFKTLQGSAGQGIYSLWRGFYSAEIVRDGDRVLDIGCGDGSYTKRFYAPRAGHVDGIDIEPSAISYARQHNAAENYRTR